PSFCGYAMDYTFPYLLTGRLIPLALRSIDTRAATRLSGLDPRRLVQETMPNRRTSAFAISFPAGHCDIQKSTSWTLSKAVLVVLKEYQFN
ncbi:2417_t:CDS:2, partial [Acaulospora colombiana]